MRRLGSDVTSAGLLQRTLFKNHKTGVLNDTAVVVPEPARAGEVEDPGDHILTSSASDGVRRTIGWTCRAFRPHNLQFPRTIVMDILVMARWGVLLVDEARGRPIE